jgi:small subunit ribosomal protein S2
MERLPGAVFVIDPKREELLVKEANRLKIPVVALTDTNCDPDVVDYVIPGNDDAIRSINLISRLISNSIIEGRGEEAPSEDRPVPPAVEEAILAEEEAAQPLSEAAQNGGLSADQPTGLADPVESAGEIASEEDPTTSYRGAEKRREREQAGESVTPEDVELQSGDEEEVPGGGSLRPGEEQALSEGAGEEVPAGEGAAEQPQDEPSGDTGRNENDQNEES